jgi:flagellar biosynthesis protein FlhG
VKRADDLESRLSTSASDASRGSSSGGGRPVPLPEAREPGRTGFLFERLFGSSGRAADAMAPEAPVLAIASGKGGTGKSFLSTSLGIVAARRGSRTSIVDCDFGLATDHLLLGVHPEQTLQHVVDGSATMVEARVDTPYGPGLVPGGAGLRRMADLSDGDMLRFGRELGRLSTAEDLLILDIGAGLSPQGLSTVLAADQVVLVTHPEIAALTDAYAVAKCLVQQRPNVRVAVVVNRVHRPGLGEATFEKLAEVARRFTGLRLHYLGEIPDDPAVTQRRLGQAPLVHSDPSCAVSEAIENILTGLEELVGPFRRRDPSPGNGLADRLRASLAAKT